MTGQHRQRRCPCCGAESWTICGNCHRYGTKQDAMFLSAVAEEWGLDGVIRITTALRARRQAARRRRAERKSA